MKSLLIHGESQPPDELREIIEKGSTVLEKRHVSTMEVADADRSHADRVVFWAGAEDTSVTALASAYAGKHDAEPDRRLVFIRSETTAVMAPKGVAAAECFVWPRDEDRVKLTFMTGG